MVGVSRAVRSFLHFFIEYYKYSNNMHFDHKKSCCVKTENRILRVIKIKAYRYFQKFWKSRVVGNWYGKIRGATSTCCSRNPCNRNKKSPSGADGTSPFGSFSGSSSTGLVSGVAGSSTTAGGSKLVISLSDFFIGDPSWKYTQYYVLKHNLEDKIKYLNHNLWA